MNTALINTEEEAERLKQFHRNHFPNQAAPSIYIASAQGDQVSISVTDEHAIQDLGYYPDGSRRTLTDEQIAMFRNSEIQRLLNERRRQREVEESERYDEEQSEAEHENPHQAGRQKQEQGDTPSQGKRRFPDDVVEDNPVLMYDDEPTKAAGGTKQFIWPKLG